MTEDYKSDLRQAFRAGTWLGLGKILNITVRDGWKQKGEVFEGFKESWGINCRLMLPIEELMGLLGSSCLNNHPICLGRKSKEMLM